MVRSVRSSWTEAPVVVSGPLLSVDQPEPEPVRVRLSYFGSILMVLRGSGRSGASRSREGMAKRKPRSEDWVSGRVFGRFDEFRAFDEYPDDFGIERVLVF